MANEAPVHTLQSAGNLEDDRADQKHVEFVCLKDCLLEEINERVFLGVGHDHVNCFIILPIIFD